MQYNAHHWFKILDSIDVHIALDVEMCGVLQRTTMVEVCEIFVVYVDLNKN